MVKVKPHKKFEGVYLVNGRLATKNLTPGKSVYGEKLFKFKNIEYREWIAHRSKPAAAIRKGLKVLPLRRGMKILYLGLASSTTASHFSDIIGKEGIIYGIEISSRTLRESIPVAEIRGNIVPILGDAQTPESYNSIVSEEVDLVYCDVAIREQSEILIRNAEMFLKPGGYAMIAIKSRSIDVTAKPRKVYKQQRKILEQTFDITDFVTLDPYERDHCLFICKLK
jgi:fibrillarin-like pre-rRNA processing protein